MFRFLIMLKYLRVIIVLFSCYVQSVVLLFYVCFLPVEDRTVCVSMVIDFHVFFL